MKRKATTGLMLTLLLVGMITLAFQIQQVKADWTWTETIYIRADGSVEPDTAPISSVDNITYTLTDSIVGDVPTDVSAIVVERDNIVVDGAGYTLQGTGADYSTGIDLTGRSNVTIKNTNIKGFYHGIYLYYSSSNTVIGNNATTNTAYGIILLDSSYNTVIGNNATTNGDGISLWYSSNNTISGNNIANNGWGIFLEYSSYNTIIGNNAAANTFGISLLVGSSYNTIIGNNAAANTFGISLHDTSNNTFYHNNFIDNTLQVYSEVSTNLWDNGYPSGGNFWSDHSSPDIYSGENQDVPGSDAIGDIQYTIDENNTDRYPLIYPYGYVFTPDVNDDGIVDILDLRICGKAFGCGPGDMNWNPLVDLKTDGLINIFDLWKTAKHYGEHV